MFAKQYRMIDYQGNMRVISYNRPNQNRTVGSLKKLLETGQLSQLASSGITMHTRNGCCILSIFALSTASSCTWALGHNGHVGHYSLLFVGCLGQRS